MVDVELYGGRRGFLEHLRARTLYVLGAYRSARQINWADVGRLVFICKGNICRSPYACARARLLGVQAVSFGLEAADGAPAAPAALGNALLRGVDLCAHRSTRMRLDRLTDRDLLIVFEPRQMNEVRRRIGNRIPAHLLGVWSRPVRPHIQDPYGMTDRYFQECFSVIDASITALVDSMTRSAGSAMSGERTERLGEDAMHGRSCEGTGG